MAGVGFAPSPSLAAEIIRQLRPSTPAFVLGFVRTVAWRESTLMPLGLDKVRKDRFFAQCLARLKPMQTLHEDEALAVSPD
jgi:hypothetical protein